ncbi:transporter suffix domain-containing protein [Clostridium intestinale]|uniref:Transporter suffix domain-containing protein n=1 Tax=Clostridium intestinale URNW TaxID=1294142 RepID=U2N0R2_9CLOT|nr:transporter suffix domain-containing protein [Clostridium intestinale]ERK29072.1 hypothetical protein CINTURNW_3497 [Clostridium intestinale URNW]
MKKINNYVLRRCAIFLIVISFVLYGLIPIIPFTALTLPQKAIVIPSLVLVGEITWWIGVAIVGKEFIVKIKSYFCNKFCNKKGTNLKGA